MRFLVAGVVRNCAAQLERDVARIAAALSGVGSVQWLLVESDSTDGTVATLQKLSASIEGFSFDTQGALRDRFPIRTDRIRICRNRYVQAIRTDPRHANVDFVVVADFDGVNTCISREALDSCWTRADWDVCTANQDGPYYDIFALRHPLWSPNDCWEQFHFMREYCSNEERVLHSCVLSRMVRIPPGSDWIEVDSAFGGFAIYRRALFDAADYGEPLHGERDACEHVVFHSALKARGFRIFVNPALINARRTDHVRLLTFGSMLQRRADGLARRIAKTILPDRWLARIKATYRQR
jgi:hypothetical protein